ncbi:MAG: TonB family protein [Gammaproteobacteria bacterium]|nr:TonB family protein [Gammaproteobacteria bacterium]
MAAWDMGGWTGMLDSALAERLGWVLIHSLWQCALVALALYALLRFVPRRYANARYGLAGLALVVSVLAPVLTFFLLASEPVGTALRPASLVDEAPAVVSAALAMEQGDWRSELAPILPWLSHVWLLGVLLLVAKMGLEYWQVQGLVRRHVRPAAPVLQSLCAELAEVMGVRRGWRLLESAAVDVPMVIGWFKPVVLLPAAVVTGLKPEQIAMILAHELAHVRRHDYLVNLAQTLAEILLFFHPAVWWISRQMRHEREHCCDDMAVALCQDPIAYARTLADTADLCHHGHHHGSLALAATGGELKLRVTRLFQGHACHPHWGSRTLAALGVLLLVTGTGIAARVQAVPKPVLPPLAEAPASVAVAPVPATTPAPQLAAVQPEALARPAEPAPRAIQTPVAVTKPVVKPAVKPAQQRLVQVAKRSQAELAAKALPPATAKPEVPVSVQAVRAEDTPAPVRVASLKPVAVQDLKQVEASVAVHTPAPEFPNAARRLRGEAEVPVSFTVGSDGRVGEIAFETGVQPAFQRSVRKALAQWRFEPRREDGQAVSERRRKVFSFALEEDCEIRTGSRICR